MDIICEYDEPMEAELAWRRYGVPISNAQNGTKDISSSTSTEATHNEPDDRLLTDEEIESRIGKFLDAHPHAQWDSNMAFRDMCEAQLEKVQDAKSKSQLIEPKPNERLLAEQNLTAEIQLLFYKYTETLACGYTGIRCDESQSGEDNYTKLSKEIVAKTDPIFKRPDPILEREHGKLVQEAYYKGYNQREAECQEEISQYREAWQTAKDECQARVERIFNKFDNEYEVIHAFGKPSPYITFKVRRVDWQALKEGVK